LEKVYQPWGRSENSDPRLDGKIEGWLLKFPELLLAARRGVWLRYTPVGEWRKGQRSYEGGTNVEHETKQNRHRLIPQTSSGSTRFSVRNSGQFAPSCDERRENHALPEKCIGLALCSPARCPLELGIHLTSSFMGSSSDGKRRVRGMCTNLSS